MTPLHDIGNWLRDTLLLVPMPIVRGLFVALPIILIIWVLGLPRAATTPPDSRGRLRDNLKLWAVLALSAQVAIYMLG